MTDTDVPSTALHMVARVLGTEDATPMSFWAAVSEGEHLQLDDVVSTMRRLPDGRSVQLSGVVTQVRARHEGASFDSDVFLIQDGVLPAAVVEAAEVSTTRVEPETYVPPQPGSEVYRVTGKARDEALYFDAMEHKLPAGIGRDGEPLYIDLEFLDGTRGAHVNISGISGIATKTTYASFLLYGLFTSGVLGSDALNSKALIFNVKGEDLLFLDHPNSRLDETQRTRYLALGLEPKPFPSASFFAPPRRGDRNAGPDVSTRATGVQSFFWTLEEFATQELLPFVFADAEDERQQYTLVIHNVTAKLRRDGFPHGDDGAWQIDGEILQTYSDLVDLLVARLSDDATMQSWAGPAIGMGTINAFIRRLLGSVKPLGALVRADVPYRAHSVSTSDAQVTVVDLHNLPDRAKRFVVGVILRQEFERKESSGRPRPLLFVVLDELNRYAPRDGSSPIKQILLDVAERGRSLGVILVGAQQTASEVERRIIANSAIRVVGRLDPAEAARPEYGFLPTAQRQRATLAKPGTMFVSQPQLPVPLVAEFPFPSWATRPSEVSGPPGHATPPDVPDDPFADLPAGRPGLDGDTPEKPPF
jgi:DNA helicase HerA-like ATPase